MGIDRRDFFRIAGLATLGFAATAGFDLIKGEEVLAALPKTKSAAGKRLAMVIDLRKCMEAGDCHDCEIACHKVHNVPDLGNEKDEIKWIWKEHFEHAFHEQEHPYLEESLKHAPSLVLCNHCDNPPCVRVCPTNATFKRDEDGIVMMDWHRCIGCRYCIVACPYGSRSFNWRDPRPFVKELQPDFPTRMRGVVEKCTFCESRLAKGLIPACVEACKHQAIAFGNLEDSNSQVRELLRTRYTIRRKPGLGTQPQVYYLV